MPAQAQEGVGLLRFLFPSREPERRVRPAPRAEPQRQRTRPRERATQPRQTRRAPQTAPSTTAPAPQTVDKAADARRVLVIGDFVAGGLAEGLEAAYAEDASVAIVERTNGSSGLVRDDYYDWPATIGGLIEEVEPTVVVVMIGANDRQNLRVDGQSHAPRTDPWLAEYRRRAGAIATAVTERDIPLIWVGMVPFRPSTMAADMLAFNDVYRRVTEEAGGEFVDIWDGFVDENGNYVQNGPDMNGQPTQLRAGDGINLTRAGRRKAAFFVEKPLARALGNAPQPELVFFGPTVPEGFFERPAPRVDRTQPIALSEPQAAETSELLGRSAGRSDDASEGGRAELEEGYAPAGRADHFRLDAPGLTNDTGSIAGSLRY